MLSWRSLQWQRSHQDNRDAIWCSDAPALTFLLDLVFREDAPLTPMSHQCSSSLSVLCHHQLHIISNHVCAHIAAQASGGGWVVEEDRGILNCRRKPENAVNHHRNPPSSHILPAAQKGPPRSESSSANLKAFDDPDILLKCAFSLLTFCS